MSSPVTITSTVTARPAADGLLLSRVGLRKEDDKPIVRADPDADHAARPEEPVGRLVAQLVQCVSVRLHHTTST